MARRKDHTREEIKEMALNAGAALLEETGLSGLSTRRIASEIGYTVGTLYNVFENYDDIILQINARTLDDLYEYVTRECGPDLDTGAAGVRRLADCYVSFGERNFARWQVLFEYQGHLTDGMPDWYAQKIDGLFRLIETALLPVVGGDAERARKSSKVLWASVHGICLLGITQRLDTVGAGSVRDLAHDLIDNYVSGLKQAA